MLTRCQHKRVPQRKRAASIQNAACPLLNPTVRGLARPPRGNFSCQFDVRSNTEPLQEVLPIFHDGKTVRDHFLVVRHCSSLGTRGLSSRPHLTQSPWQYWWRVRCSSAFYASHACLLRLLPCGNSYPIYPEVLRKGTTWRLRFCPPLSVKLPLHSIPPPIPACSFPWH